MPYCPTCKGILRPERGTLVCLRCTQAGRARTVHSGGRTIHLGKGQQGLAAPPPASAHDAPLAPKRSEWRPHADPAARLHPQLPLFPHDELRDSQRRLARDVAMAVQGGKHLVAQAPTGIGKTAASLAPALEDALRAGRTVLFLTSRQSQHRIAVDTLRRIRERRGVAFAVVDLVAKRDMCLRPEAADLHPGRFPDFCAREVRSKTCRYARDVPKDAIADVHAGVLHVEELMHVGREHDICPHMLAMEAARTAHVVVADYNHLFSDLRAQSLDRLGLKLPNVVLVVDEAHNLPERVRQNHSHRVTPFLLDQVESEARQAGARDVGQDLLVLRAVLRRLADGAKAAGDAKAELDGRGERARLGVDALLVAFEEARSSVALGVTRTLMDLTEGLRQVEARVRKGGDGVVHAEQLLEALEDWTRFGQGALRYIRWDGGPENGVELHVRLLDPALPCKDVLRQVHSTVLMSGTIRPPEAIRDMLGLDPERTMVRSYPSPFPPEHRFTAVARGLSTRFTDRSPELWARIAGQVARTCEAAKGNVAVFTPSYQVMREVRAALPDLGARELVQEDPEWGKAERDMVLDTLRGARKRGSALLMGVLGGSLSEGIDYSDNLLSAVIVVGLPLAPPDLEVDAMVEHLERRLPGRGRLYGYTVPAMVKVVQAMGRGIRSGTDKCAVVLLDSRYLQPPYRQLLPDGPIVEADDPAAAVAPFLAHHGL